MPEVEPEDDTAQQDRDLEQTPAPQIPPARAKPLARRLSAAGDVSALVPARMVNEVRSVWLSSERLGLTAKIDVVDVDESGTVVIPVEYKRGKQPEVPELAPRSLATSHRARAFRRRLACSSRLRAAGEGTCLLRVVEADLQRRDPVWAGIAGERVCEVAPAAQRAASFDACIWVAGFADTIG